MKNGIEEIFSIVNEAIDIAFEEQKYQLKFIDYLRSGSFTKDTIKEFLESSLFVSIEYQIEELNLYIKGGEKSECVKESYDWMGKPRATKLKTYLENIIFDAVSYEKSKRRGRKPGSKNKRKSSAIADK